MRALLLYYKSRINDCIDGWYLRIFSRHAWRILASINLSFYTLQHPRIFAFHWSCDNCILFLVLSCAKFVYLFWFFLTISLIVTAFIVIDFNFWWLVFVATAVLKWDHNQSHQLLGYPFCGCWSPFPRMEYFKCGKLEWCWILIDLRCKQIFLSLLVS